MTSERERFICKKCGERNVNKEYKLLTDPSTSMIYERIICECCDCGYRWAVLALDSKPAENQQDSTK